MSRIIAVYGSATVTQDSEEARLAFHVGVRLAQRGAVVMNGGYGGIMEAVSRGARETGGKVVGVTVDAFLDRKANEHLTVEHSVPGLLERLRVLTEEPDGFLALPGGIGTAAELFLAWNLLSLGLRRPAPLVLMGNALETILDRSNDKMGIPPAQYDLIHFAHDPDEAVDLVLGGSR